MRCDCGHSADHHNPAPPYNDIKNDFSGNCRNCKCLAFSVGSSSERPNTVHGLIARRRGEYIVRRWTDDVVTLKAEHALELAKRDVILEEQKRLMRMSNKKIVDLELRVVELERFIVGEALSGEDTHVGKIRAEEDMGGHDKSCPARLGSTCDCGKL